jgi:hypothetical protein
MSDFDVAVAERLVEFLGLKAAVGPTGERALRFRNGVLYPYSGDLRDVYDEYVAVASEFSDAEPLLVGDAPRGSFVLRVGDGASHALGRYVAAVDGLHRRTAFASRATDTGVDRAKTSVRDAITRAYEAGGAR